MDFWISGAHEREREREMVIYLSQRVSWRSILERQPVMEHHASHVPEARWRLGMTSRSLLIENSQRMGNKI